MYKSILSTFLFLSVIFLNLNCSEKEVIMENNTAEKISSSTSEYQVDSIAVSIDNLNETKQKELLVFIGTYTWGSSKGIYVYKLDTVTGALSYISESPFTSNPSYLAIHPNKQFVYAVNENSYGTVSAFSFDTITNQLAFINSVPVGGDAPCYVSICNSSKYIMVANYNSGSVTVCPVNSNGSLGSYISLIQHIGSGSVTGRQDSPHAHMIMQAANGYVYNTDLGVDTVFIYSLDSLSGKLAATDESISTVPGSGPRHMAFHPMQPWMYTICELSGTIESFQVNNNSGALVRFDTISSLPAGSTSAAASADIHITPDGKYLYVSNRGSYNNIAMYSIDQVTGQLILLGHQSVGGTTPRNFTVDPSGKFLLVACQDDSKIITFKIDPATGLLVSTGKQITVPNPVCLKMIEIYQEKVNTGIREYTE